jgi:hypothetical protein
VSSPYPLVHDAARLAVTGLRDAYARNYAAYRSRPTVDNIGVSAVDFANWASALDERLRVTAATDAERYRHDRDANPDGRVIGGIRFVRDRHMRQVVVSAVPDSADFFAAFPPQLSLGIVWRNVDELPEPDGRGRTNKHYERQRDAYHHHMQGKPTWVTLAAAARWLSAEVESRGVVLDPWTWP